MRFGQLVQGLTQSQELIVGLARHRIRLIKLNPALPSPMARRPLLSARSIKIRRIASAAEAKNIITE